MREGNLLTALAPGAPSAVTRYDCVYTTPGHTKLTDADGHPVTDYTVDPSGRVIRVTDAKGASRPPPTPPMPRWEASPTPWAG